ncbi:MAG: hypothetical protein A2050_07060 [Candidatus Rokubacteria bacterium GWA2_73_35]|nr:MAG: hypothetical protein A2050_07060 [Candidatus Rokubacteria bacterium GWA2_73_35]
MRSESVIASCTISASREDSSWNSDWARSQRIVRTMSARPLPRPAGFSSPTTPFSSAATCRAALSVASEDRKYVSTPSVDDWRCALAWIETKRSARSLLAKLVRSRSATNWSPSRESRTRRPSRSSTSFFTRSVTSRTSSFSMSPVGPTAPESWPPWPASSTIVRSGVTRAPGAGPGRTRSSTSRGGSSSVLGRRVPAAPSNVTRRRASGPARSSRIVSTNPSRSASTRGDAASRARRTRSSPPPCASTVYSTAPEVSSTIRVKEGYERERSSSSVAAGAAAWARGAEAARAAGGAAAPASRGSTWVTNDAGTSHTPSRTRTGASSTTGLPLTSTCAQLRVSVTTWFGRRR